MKLNRNLNSGLRETITNSVKNYKFIEKDAEYEKIKHIYKNIEEDNKIRK
jgi:hypothetical protein